MAGLRLAVAVLGCGWAWGQVVMVPRAAAVVAGRRQTFQVRGRVDGQGRLPRLIPEGWRWQVTDPGAGSVDAQGVFTAAPVDRPRTTLVRACFEGCADVRAQAQVVVLPWHPFHTVEQVLGADALAPLAGDLPFQDPATGVRPGGALLPTSRELGPPLLAGHGLPARLDWHPPVGALAVRLSRPQGGGWAVQEVTEPDRIEVRLTEPSDLLRVEALVGLPGDRATWRSQILDVPVHLRGLQVLAGHPGDPLHADGRGRAARFRAPGAVAAYAEMHGQRGFQSGCLVTDPHEHVVRKVELNGQVTTVWGQPGEPGWADDPGPTVLQRLAGWLCPRDLPAPGRQGRFRRPTHLCPAPAPDDREPWRYALADSGNHVIRSLHQDGRVTTLAGHPGLSGHRDHDQAREARFRDPRGLAMGPDGSLYVADRGNHVIRRITPAGGVTTLAGVPGQAGTQDGPAREARFTALGDLALGEAGQALWVIDQHALRRLDLAAGTVTTVLGRVDTPGFLDVSGAALEERRAAQRLPCLNAPAALLVSRPGGLVIADRGNHAVRVWRDEDAQLITLAGDPDQPELRPGALRDGLDGPPDRRFGALLAPCGLAELPPGSATYWVASGPCLVQVNSAVKARVQLADLELRASPGRRGEPWVLRLNLPGFDAEGEAQATPLDYQVDLREADGSLAQHLEGRAWTGRPFSVQGTFQQPGSARVEVRCLTLQGMAAGGVAEVQVR